MNIYSLQGYPGDFPVLDLIDFKKEALEIVLHYLYTAEIDGRLNPETVQDVLIAADFLLLDDLVNLCCLFIAKRITPENCLSVRQFAKFLGLK